MNPVSNVRGSIGASIVSIVVAGAIAAIGAWAIVAALELTGVVAALVAVIVAMVLGILVFAIGVRIFGGKSRS
ncbi:MAG TPA: hypothetical protein VFC24_02695 [Casimicrobiaceae bacterium]|nr:hypothetical protein [Casimicrobiaceae bacterium]